MWAPLVALYVMLMLGVKWKFSFKTFVHLIPQLLSFTYWIYEFSQDAQHLELMYINRTNGIYTWQVEAFQIVIIFQAIFYLGYSARLIHKKSADKTQSNVSAVRLKWLKQFIYILSGLIFLLIIFSFLVAPVIIDYIIAPILYGISNIFLVYKGLNSSGIFTNQTVDELKVLKERYTGSTLKPEQVVDYRTTLVKYLEDNEPYTNPELTLNDLAEMTGIQTHHLSQTINQEFGKNFFDLINGYRIEKAKMLMQDSKTANLTLEAIGLQSGFGSASSFYRSFKKQTGITPNAFLKAHGSKGK